MNRHAVCAFLILIICVHTRSFSIERPTTQQCDDLLALLQSMPNDLENDPQVQSYKIIGGAGYPAGGIHFCIVRQKPDYAYLLVVHALDNTPFLAYLNGRVIAWSIIDMQVSCIPSGYVTITMKGNNDRWSINYGAGRNHDNHRGFMSDIDLRALNSLKLELERIQMTNSIVQGVYKSPKGFILTMQYDRTKQYPLTSFAVGADSDQHEYNELIHVWSIAINEKIDRSRCVFPTDAELNAFNKSIESVTVPPNRSGESKGDYPFQRRCAMYLPSLRGTLEQASGCQEDWDELKKADAEISDLVRKLFPKNELIYVPKTIEQVTKTKVVGPGL